MAFDSAHTPTAFVMPPNNLVVPPTFRGVYFTYGLTPQINFGVRNPTVRAVRGFNTGRFQFGLVRGGKHILFLMIKQAPFMIGWADVPIARGSLPSPKRRDVRSPTQGYIFSLVLSDETGAAVSARAVGVSLAFSMKLDELLTEQASNRRIFTIADRNAEITAAHSRWPSAEDMVPHACIIETVGRDAPEGM